MAKLIYSAITPLDGYVADESGKFDWAVPDDEVHGLINDLERPIGTIGHLVGRSRTGCPCDGGWTRRRIPPIPHAHCDWRR